MIIPRDGPLHGWLRGARAAEAEDKEDSKRKKVTTNKRLQRFIREHDWPDLESVPKPEIPGKGLGPLQWWRVFGTFAARVPPCMSLTDMSQLKIVGFRRATSIAGRVLDGKRRSA